VEGQGLPKDQIYTFMELVLHGLAEMNVINKNFVEATLTFNDSLADMLNEEDDEDDDIGFN
jgi:magnesium chelatase subunit I